MSVVNGRKTQSVKKPAETDSFIHWINNKSEIPQIP